MHEIFHKYFWNGKENISPDYQLRRIIEYASFDDLIKYSFDEVKLYIDKINLEKLWTGETRKMFMIHLKPYIKQSNTWEEAIKKMTNDALKASLQVTKMEDENYY